MQKTSFADPGRIERVADHLAETAMRQVLERRNCLRPTAAELFGVKITSGLPSACAVCRRSKWKYCAGVVQFATRMLSSAHKRQKTFHARARMLRPLAFVAVRQQHHQAARLAPLLLGGRYELVDDDLRAVREIAELRFPQVQRLRLGHAVAEFKAEHAKLAQRAVVNVERRLLGARCCSGM